MRSPTKIAEPECYPSTSNPVKLVTHHDLNQSLLVNTKTPLSMKPLASLLLILIFQTISGFSAEPQKTAPSKTDESKEADKEFHTPKRDRKKLKAKSKHIEGLPNVLIIGDSISVGYTPQIISDLTGTANVSRIPENGGDTGRGIAKLDKWLGDKKWDVIHFNWGLWDLCYRHPESKNQGKRDKIRGTQTFTIEQYSKNLETLVTKLKATKAKLIWASTTFVPEGEAGRVLGDDHKFNAAAKKIMEKHGIPINDLNAFSQTIQQHAAKPGDVHFTKTGSKELGKKVAREIKKQLE